MQRNDEITREALARHEAHINHASSRPLSENYELVGLRGEDVLARTFGVKVDMSRRLDGDNGVDIWINLSVGGEIRKYPIDIKTARKPFNLIVEQGKVKRGTIYILAGYNDRDDDASLIGWEWSRTVSLAPIKDFGYGILNHYINRAKLRRIKELLERAI